MLGGGTSHKSCPMSMPYAWNVQYFVCYMGDFVFMISVGSDMSDMDSVAVPGALWKFSTHGPPLNMLYGNGCLAIMAFDLFQFGATNCEKRSSFWYISSKLEVPSIKKRFWGSKATELRQKEKTQNEANRLEVKTLRSEPVFLMPPMEEENDIPSNLWRGYVI